MDGIGEYHAKWNRPIPKKPKAEWYIMGVGGVGSKRRMEEL